MPEPDYTLRQNDSGESITATLEDSNGDAVNLTGAAVMFQLAPIAGGALVVNGAATITDAAGGNVAYMWRDEDTEVPGWYLGSWRVTFSGGEVQTYPNGGYTLVQITGELGQIPQSSAPIIASASGAPTDEVIQISHGGAEPTPLPILAVDLDAQTVTVGGDQTAVLALLEQVPPGAGMTIAGSTGNDSPAYVPTSSVYNSGSNRTTITLDTDEGGSLSSPVADGTLQFPIIYLIEIAIPPDGAVEWVLIDTTEEWSGGFYGVIGDDDDPQGYASRVGSGEPGGVEVGQVGRWQWPLNTVNAASSNPVVLVGNYPGIKFYPDGGTVRVIWTEILGGSAGKTTIVVHHHFTEPITAGRIPAAA